MVTPPTAHGTPVRTRSGLVRLIFAGTLLITLLTGLSLSWHSMGGLDIWLHDQVGQDLIQGKHPGDQNTYSFTEPDHLWTNHEWLFQVLVASLGSGSSGSAGSPDQLVHRWNILRSILVALLLIAIMLGDHTLRAWKNEPGQLWARLWLGLPMILGFAMLWTRLLLRPELLSYLFLVLIVRILDRPLPRLTARRAWLDLVNPRQPLGQVFLLTVLWNQFHGFSALGPVLYGLTLMSAVLQGKIFPDGPTREPSPGKADWRLLGAALPVLILSLMISPNGVQGLVYPLRAMGQFSGSTVDLRQTISELVPLLETKDSLGLSLIAYKFSLAWAVVWIALTWSRLSVLRIFLWLLAALAAYAGQRNLGFYAVAFLLLHTGSRGLAPWIAPVLNRVRLPQPVLGIAGLALTIVVSLSWMGNILDDSFYLQEGVSRRFGTGSNPGRYPVVAGRMLAAQPDQKLFCNVDAAAFLLNQGQVRLYIDGRTEAYSPQMWENYTLIRQANHNSLDMLINSGAEKAFISVASGSFRPLAGALLADQRWQLDHFDETGFLFSRSAQAGHSSITQVKNKFSTLVGVLPSDNTHLSPARAADLCLAWATIMELGQNHPLQEQALRQALDWHPEHPTARHNLGNFLMAQGQWELALTHFEKALATNPRLSGSALNAGVCLLQAGQAQSAVGKFRQAVSIDPDNFQAWANLGITMQSMGKTAEAISALQRALELNPGDQRLRQIISQFRNSR